MALLVGPCQKLILISIDGITSQHRTTASNRVLSPFFSSRSAWPVPPPLLSPHARVSSAAHRPVAPHLRLRCAAQVLEGF